MTRCERDLLVLLAHKALQAPGTSDGGWLAQNIQRALRALEKEDVSMRAEMVPYVGVSEEND